MQLIETQPWKKQDEDGNISSVSVRLKRVSIRTIKIFEKLLKY